MCNEMKNPNQFKLQMLYLVHQAVLRDVKENFLIKISKFPLQSYWQTLLNSKIQSHILAHQIRNKQTFLS